MPQVWFVYKCLINKCYNIEILFIFLNFSLKCISTNRPINIKNSKLKKDNINTDFLLIFIIFTGCYEVFKKYYKLT